MSGALRRTFVMTGTVALFGTETEIDMAIDADVVLGKPQTRKYYGAPAKIEIESIYIDGLAKDGNASMGYLWMRTVPPHMVDYGVTWLMSDEAVSVHVLPGSDTGSNRTLCRCLSPEAPYPR